jgi:hypothetical protein
MLWDPDHLPPADALDDVKEFLGVLDHQAVATASTTTSPASVTAIRHAYGNLLCRAAISAGVDGRQSDAETFMAEAEREAHSLGEPEHGGFGLLWFGPTSTGVASVRRHRAGRHRHRYRHRAGVDPRPMQAPNRVVYYWTDYGRALESAGKDDEAVRAFSEAEMVDPQRFRLDPMVKDSVSALIHRAKRRAVAGPLLTMAQRLGLEDVA